MEDVLRKLKENQREERDRKLRTTYQKKPAWSENIFAELSLEALKDFYMRACKEIEDIKVFFSINQINYDVIFEAQNYDETTNPERAQFIELCYLCRVKEHQV